MTPLSSLFRYVCLLTILLGSLTTLHAQVLPEARSSDWSDVGCQDFSGNWTVLNILDFGGSADGIESNDDAVLDALAFLDGTPGVLFFPPGEYLFQKPIELTDQLVLRGASFDQSVLVFDLLESDYAIQAVGEKTTDETHITSPITKGDTRVDVENPGLFQQGDYVMIFDLDTARITSVWAMQTTGQIHKVTGINDSSVRLQNPFRRAYQLSDDPRIVRIVPRQKVAIEYLAIMRKDEATVKNSNILFQYAANCRVQCIESEFCDFAHVEVAQSTNIEIRGSYFHHAFDYVGGGNGYGVVLHFATGQCLVENNIFEHLRHSLLLQAGANGNVISYNYSTDPFWEESGFPSDAAGDLVLHGNYPYANLLEGNIVQNIVIDDSHGQQGPHNTFLRNRAEGYGIFMGIAPAPNSQNIIGNEITGDLGLFFTTGEDHFLYGNNDQGTIKPSGTEILEDDSYYLDSIPEYFQLPNAWPAIGPANEIGSVVNEAYSRFQAGAFVACTDQDFGPAVEPPVTTQVLNAVDLNDFLVYPNPANERLFVAFNPAIAEDGWTIQGVNGQTVRSGKKLPLEIDLSPLPSGVYFLAVQLVNGTSINRKFVVVRR